MVPSFLIMFRESLEAVLVVGIVLGFLRKTGAVVHLAKVWLGVGLGVATSVMGAVLFQFLAGRFQGRSEQLFEASTMLAGSVLMTSAVIWMTGYHGPQKSLEKTGDTTGWGFFLLIYVSILREGIEAVLFLAAARFASPDNDILGAVIGLVTALALGWLLLRASFRVRLSTFFLAVNSLLVLFAAGLVAQGLHELTEAGVLPPLVDRVWDINRTFSDQGYVGDMVRGMFGYRGAPTLIELSGYVLYLALAVPLVRATWLKRRTAEHHRH